MAHLPKGTWLPRGCPISLRSRLPMCQRGMVMGPHFEGCGRRKCMSAHSCLLWRDRGRSSHLQELEELRLQTGKEGRRKKRGRGDWRAAGGREEMSKEEAGVCTMTRLPSTSPKA